jgi:two-component system cell cycle response regulator
VLDVTAIRSTQDALEVARAEAHHASQTDPLTGVWNRRSLVAQMTALGDGPVGVLMVDIDHSKNTNDLFGHAAGDAVLIAVAALGQTTRANDAIFRMGGEEFLVVLPGPFDYTAVHDVAEGVCRRIGSEPVTVSGERIQPTASIGAARCDSLSGNIDMLLRAADRALYAAKRAGRDRVWLASDDTDADDAPVADSATLRLAKAMAIVGAKSENSRFSRRCNRLRKACRAPKPDS